MRRCLSLAALLATTGALLALPGAAPAQAATGLVPVGAPFAKVRYDKFFGSIGTSEAFSSPVAGDVTGDGHTDIVSGGMDGILRVFSSTGRLEGQIDTGAGAIQSSPALADVDRDGVLDVTVGNTANVIATFAFTGGTVRTLFYRRDVGQNGQNLVGIFGTPAVTDLNGDGRMDVVVSSWDHWVYAYSTGGGQNGSILPGWPQHLYDTSWSSPAIGDVDGDGAPDVVVGGDCDGVAGQPCGPAAGRAAWRGGYVWAFRRDGSLIWRHEVRDQVVWSSPALADLDGNGTLEVVSGTGTNMGAPAGSFVFAVDGRTGARRWTVGTDGRALGSPAEADVDGDGTVESLVLSEHGQLTMVNADGGVRWRSCVDSRQICPSDGQMHGSAVIADIDGDGTLEAVSLAENHLIVTDARTGRTEDKLSPPSSYFYAPAAAPAVVQVDGRATVLASAVVETGGAGRGVGDSLGIFAWTTGRAPGALPWGVFKGDQARRGVRAGAPVDPVVTRKYVAALYVDFLGRPADSGGLGYWTGLITSGTMTRQQVAYALAGTDEWLTHVLDGYYRTTLGRAPDAAGLAAWIAAIRRGTPIAQVATAFYASDEYYARSGGTPTRWVSALYTALLHRQPDSAGLQGWVAFSARYGRTPVAAGFYGSPETLANRVSVLYRSLLDRAPDASGLRTWPAVVATQGDLVLAAYLASSDEYVAIASR